MSYHEQNPGGSYQTVPQQHIRVPVAPKNISGYANDPCLQQRITPPATIYVGDASQSLFNSKQIRSAFVSKVYTILFVQLLVATGIVALFTLHQPTKDYFTTTGTYWLYIALVAGLSVYFVLICVESARRSYPLNFILLGVLTLAYGFIAGIFSARYSTVTVLSAFGATAFATLVVILLAKFSSFDITACGCALCILGMVHLFATLILIILLGSTISVSTGSLIIAGTGAFLVSLYLMFDLQLIMGGRSIELSPEEYILASVMLYIDIINLFQYMLILFGRSD